MDILVRVLEIGSAVVVVLIFLLGGVWLVCRRMNSR